MDPIWIPIWILYGSYMDPYMDPYTDPCMDPYMYGSYVDPYMDHIWTIKLIPLWILYGSYMDPYMDPICTPIYRSIWTDIRPTQDRRRTGAGLAQDRRNCFPDTHSRPAETNAGPTQEQRG